MAFARGMAVGAERERGAGGGGEVIEGHCDKDADNLPRPKTECGTCV